MPSSDVTRTVIAFAPTASGTWWPAAVSASAIGLPSESRYATEAPSSLFVAENVSVSTSLATIAV